MDIRLFQYYFFKCPKPSCDCNCNYFHHDLYLEECRKKGYPEKEIFTGENERFISKVKRAFAQIKTGLRG